ncbi:putative amino acid oxidase [Diaporthe ampelina]|uniref:Putative amino acid oxidase n=1 Tax=Diaporthe ampelina TaxID=1214573 RepID=A0A0G2F7S7_9PEZI|nr:putative amino acid oxidase [Diaporthe ampelina]
MSSQIIVIGAGVTGLSCAIQLQEAGHAAPGAVTLIARDFPTPFALVDPKAQINFTSPWGGAHNRWVPPPTDGQAQPNGLRDHRLALATFRRMRSLQESNPEAGITFMKGIEYLEDPAPEYRALAREGGEGSAKALGLEGFRVLDRSELPDDKVSLGIEYDTWCVNPMVYCSFLLNRFVFRGGRILRREISRPEEVFEMRDLGGPVKAVVNASGMGFNDPKSYIIRDGSWTFCVPRNFEGGTIIGGTKEPNNWDTEPSLEVRDRLVRAFMATHPKIADESGSVRVLKDVVGRRPARHGGARLEREEVAPGKVVVHAYGLGGRGYELSWGVAETAQKLLDEANPAKARI